MSCWAIIPVKSPGKGKQRLASVLGEVERGALVEAMLARVIAAARAAPSISEIAVIGADQHTYDDGIVSLADPGGGLNAAARFALDHLVGHGISRLLIVHADLPKVSSADLEALAAAPPHTIALAPDRHGIGTNAISLPLPAAAGFAFAFGPGSFARHGAEANRLGLRSVAILRPGLAADVDEPADLADVPDLLTTAMPARAAKIR